MILYTIGFTQKNAQTFFELIRNNRIDLVLDIRLNNKSQLAGFTKGDDLDYFLSEICHCAYLHRPNDFAPTKEILDDYKKKGSSWADYVMRYTALMEKRRTYVDFFNHFYMYNNICLLCSEPTPEQCHRRLLAEMIAEASEESVEILHL